MITLHESTSQVFNTMGIGALQPISCQVSEEENGEFELEMEYPVTGTLFNELTLRRIIVAKPSPTGSPQPFRIYEVSKEIGGTVTVYARHISYDLNTMCLSPFTSDTLQDFFENVNNNFVGTSPFTITTTKQSYSDSSKEENKFEVKSPSTARKILMDSMPDTYKHGIWKFDNFNCTYFNAGDDSSDSGQTRGANRGTILYYGKNFTDITQEVNNSRVVSAIYPFWGKSETTNSLSSVLMRLIESFMAGNVSVNTIVMKTGLDRETILGYIDEYKNSNPHKVDLSALKGRVLGGGSTQDASYTLVGDDRTTEFITDYNFTEIKKVTFDGKNYTDYTYNFNTQTIHFNNAPPHGVTIVIKGTLPAMVTLPGKLYAKTGIPDALNCIPVDFSSKFSNAPTVQDLQKECEIYWDENLLGTPEISITIGYKDLHRVNEFMNIPGEVNEIEIGDTIRIMFAKMGIESTAQVTRIIYDAVRDEITEVGLGDPKNTFAKDYTKTQNKAYNGTSSNDINQVVGKRIVNVETMYALSDSNTTPPTAAVWSTNAPNVTSGKYVWRKRVTEYDDGYIESSDYTCLDSGLSSLYTQVQGMQTEIYAAYDDYHPIFFLKTGINKDTPPTAPADWVESTSSAANIWTTVIPSPVVGGVYYSSGQSIDGAGSVTNFPVSRDDFNTRMMQWMATADATKIDGGQIYARSISALQLSTNALQSINYTGPADGEHFSQSGSFNDLATGNITTPAFSVDAANETAYIKGTIEAEAGHIGVFSVDDSGLIVSNPTLLTTTKIYDGLLSVKTGNSYFSTGDESQTGAFTFDVKTYQVGAIASESTLGSSISMSAPAEGHAPHYDNGGGYLEGYWTIGPLTRLSEHPDQTLYDWLTDIETSAGGDTWRPVKVNGTQVLGGQTTTALELANGSGTTVNWDSDNKKIKIDHSNAITAQTNYALKAIKYDANGHITATRAAVGSDLPLHEHPYADRIEYSTATHEIGLYHGDDSEDPISSANLPAATTTADGLLAYADKQKLNNLPTLMLTYEEV